MYYIVTCDCVIAGVTAPAVQYAVYNKSFSLQCDSSHAVQSRVWRDSQNKVHSGSFDPASLQDEGQYTCHLTVMGKSETLGAQLLVIGKTSYIAGGAYCVRGVVLSRAIAISDRARVLACDMHVHLALSISFLLLR